MAGQSNACIATSCLLDQIVPGLCRLLLAANMAATRQWFAIMFGMLLLTSSSATELSLLFELLTQIGSGTGSVEAIGRIVRATDQGAPQRHRSIQGLAHLDTWNVTCAGGFGGRRGAAWCQHRTPFGC
jgi:hypothetical protein